ncbi:hypothetical protein PN485_14525 [Nodularia spumigena CS-588/05]|uniref:hypothetical protein n=1 Tax=Nodularia spumigena TaxID=70799 RepID=UPI0023306C17|nr:hypothetical protein [Nodularia spumigena]MDB9353199.1 hypothetical protein [Nodularia spumigena CS-588/05]MDB9366613.1 hypothetical protein [Nodularia spumigena CS-588/02A10]MDB9401291.1 hypothetical protein [Microcystis aeruginosa CS-567/02-A1]
MFFYNSGNIKLFAGWLEVGEIQTKPGFLMLDYSVGSSTQSTFIGLTHNLRFLGVLGDLAVR